MNNNTDTQTKTTKREALLITRVGNFNNRVEAGYTPESEPELEMLAYLTERGLLVRGKRVEYFTPENAPTEKADLSAFATLEVFSL